MIGTAASDAGIEPVEPPVGEVREDDHAAGHDVRPTAVFVDAAPDVERRRGQVGGRAVGGGAHEDPPSALGRPALDPEDVVTIDRRLGQGDDVADDVFDPDR